MYKVVKVGERLLRTNGGVLEVVMTYACLREHGMGEVMVGELAFGILGRALHVMSLGWREWYEVEKKENRFMALEDEDEDATNVMLSS